MRSDKAATIYRINNYFYSFIIRLVSYFIINNVLLHPNGFVNFAFYIVWCFFFVIPIYLFFKKSIDNKNKMLI